MGNAWASKAKYFIWEGLPYVNALWVKAICVYNNITRRKWNHGALGILLAIFYQARRSSIDLKLLLYTAHRNQTVIPLLFMLKESNASSCWKAVGKCFSRLCSIRGGNGMVMWKLNGRARVPDIVKYCMRAKPIWPAITKKAFGGESQRSPSWFLEMNVSLPIINIKWRNAV